MTQINHLRKQKVAARLELARICFAVDTSIVRHREPKICWATSFGQGKYVHAEKVHFQNFLRLNVIE